MLTAQPGFLGRFSRGFLVRGWRESHSVLLVAGRWVGGVGRRQRRRQDLEWRLLLRGVGRGAGESMVATRCHTPRSRSGDGLRLRIDD